MIELARKQYFYNITLKDNFQQLNLKYKFATIFHSQKK